MWRRTMADVDVTAVSTASASCVHWPVSTSKRERPKTAREQCEKLCSVELAVVSHWNLEMATANIQNYSSILKRAFPPSSFYECRSDNPFFFKDISFFPPSLDARLWPSLRPITVHNHIHGIFLPVHSFVVRLEWHKQEYPRGQRCDSDGAKAHLLTSKRLSVCNTKRGGRSI